jgi:hypothetical protein
MLGLSSVQACVILFSKLARRACCSSRAKQLLLLLHLPAVPARAAEAVPNKAHAFSTY